MIERKALALAAGLTLLGTASADAYEFKYDAVGHPLRWHSMPIPYAISAKGARDLPLERAEAAVVNAFDAWAGAQGADIRFEYKGLGEGLAVGFDRSGGGTNAVVWSRDEWAHEPDALAVTVSFFETQTGRMLDGDIIINERHHTWSDRGERHQNDLQNALTHEVGHFLGLAHSADPEASMYASASAGETRKRTLAPDDEAAVARLYPAPKADGTPVAPPDGPLRDDAVEPPDPTGEQKKNLEAPGLPELTCQAAPGTLGPAWWLAIVAVAARRRREGRR